MKRYRLGAWIGQESYLDRKTRKRKTCETWTVKYQAFGRAKGDYHQCAERGFLSESDALAWWTHQKQNPDRDVPKAEVIKPALSTVADFLEQWLKSSRRALSAGAFRQYESHVREHIIPSLGTRLLVELEREPALIEEAMASWKRRDGRPGDLSPLFVKKVWSTLRTACNKARKLKKLASNPCDCVDPPKVERKERQHLDSAQARQFLAAFDGTLIGAAITTAIGSGLRCGELLALRWRNVDLERGTLRVEQSLERVAHRTASRIRYELNFKEPKSKLSRRTVVLPPFVVNRLRRHRLEQAERYLHAGAGRPDGDTLVFDTDGQPWIPTSFGMLFARLRDDLHLPKVRLHDLRHSYASLLLEAGIELKVISGALGHSSVAITADLYAHLTPVLAEDAAARLEALLESPARTGTA